MADVNSLPDSQVKLLDEIMSVEEQYRNRAEKQASSKYNKKR